MNYNDTAFDDVYTIDLSGILRNFVKGLKRLFWLIPLLALSAALLFCLYARKKYSPRYTAAATFTVNLDLASDGSIYEDSLRASQLSATFPYIITSNVLKNIIAEDLKLAEVTERISADNVKDTNLFTIRVTSDNPARAYEVLQSVIKNYPKVAETVVGVTRLNMIEETGIPTMPSNPVDYQRLIIYGAEIGAALALFLIIIYALAEKTIHKPDDLTQVTNVKLLGLLPHLHERKKGLIGDVRKRAGQNDRLALEYMDDLYRIRTRLNKIADSGDKKTLLITSAVPAEGKSTFAFNLALAMAELDRKVILIDCDFRRPSIIKMLPDSAGNIYLNDVLEGKEELSDAIRYYDEYKIAVLACVKPIHETSEIMGTRGIGAVLEQLKEDYDCIILDSAPSAIISDTLELAKFADGVIYVIRQDFSKVRQIQKGMEHIVESSRAEIIGCVLNNVRHLPAGNGYGYGYGYYGRYGQKAYKRKINVPVTDQANQAGEQALP